MQDRAEKRDPWAVDRLLSRPLITSETEPYWFAFLTLARDRPTESISLGMGGGLTLPRPIPRETIRRDGSRLGYEADALDDFVEIIALIDDFHVELEVRRIAATARADAEKARHTKR